MQFMKMARARGVRAFVACVVTAGLCVAALSASRQPPGALVARIGGTSPFAFLVAAAGWLALVFVQCLRWHLVASRVGKLPFLEALALRAIGNLANTVLPARGGDAVRVELFRALASTSRAAVVGAELADVWLDKIGWLPSLVLVCAVGSPPEWVPRAAMLMTLLIVAAYALATGARRLKRRPAWLEAALGAIAPPERAGAWLAPLLIAPLPWLLETAVLIGVGRVAGIELGPTGAFVLLTAQNLALIVPTPAGLGAAEAGAASALVALGFPREESLTFAVVYRLGQLGAIVVAGVGAALLVARKLKRARALTSAP
jgi:uncharacterized membrane protein YbhN (UPF0104 family)